MADPTEAPRTAVNHLTTRFFLTANTYEDDNKLKPLATSLVSQFFHYSLVHDRKAVNEIRDLFLSGVSSADTSGVTKQEIQVLIKAFREGRGSKEPPRGWLRAGSVWAGFYGGGVFGFYSYTAGRFVFIGNRSRRQPVSSKGCRRILAGLGHFIFTNIAIGSMAVVPGISSRLWFERDDPWDPTEDAFEDKIIPALEELMAKLPRR